MSKFYEQKNKENKGLTDRATTEGFTLVETLVALSIFTMSIVALMVILSYGITNTNYAKSKIEAIYLAQDGIETIRNLRDTLVLYSSNATTGWDAFNNKLIAATCNNTTNGCYFDSRNVSFANPSMPITNLILTACTSLTCANAPLLFDPTTGQYNYASGLNSGFTRKINMTQIVNSNGKKETKIFSTVYWTQGSGTYSISYAEDLFNWIE